MSLIRGSVQEGYIKTALRLPPDLHSRIHKSARESGRTFNAELIARLAGSYEQALDKSTAERLIEALQTYVAKT
ncbi:TPA: Arc family DNA-binding protein [Stenotrophomonas maltophilia]|nr:Arc family DNA-binding protein [Stenotrophomonas maltophilia]